MITSLLIVGILNSSLLLVIVVKLNHMEMRLAVLGSRVFENTTSPLHVYAKPKDKTLDNE